MLTYSNLHMEDRIELWVLSYVPGFPDENSIDGVTKLAPLVAMYAGHPDLLFHVEDVIRMTQDSDTNVAISLAAAR